MPSTRRVFRALALRTLFLLSAGPAAFAADWTKLDTPWFSVMSELSESRTRAWATEFEIYRRGLQQLLPLDASRIEPVTIILFSSDRRFKDYKPLENGKPARLAGYFVRRPGRNLLAIAVEGARDDTREIIYHEGVHWYLSGLDQPLPLWLEEGLGELFGTFALSGNTFLLGADKPHYTRHVRIAKPMPFEQLAAVRAGELEFNGKHGEYSELFYTQSWVAVHDLMCSRDTDNWPRLRDYLSKGATSDDAGKNFEKAFGVNDVGMDVRMKLYIRGTKLRTWKFTFDRANIDQGFVASPATPAETDLVLGGLLVGTNRLDEAETYLWRAAAALPQNPRPREALAEVELARRNYSGAVDHYRVAEAMGGRSYAGYFFLGQAGLQNAALTRNADGIKEVADNFLAAIRHNARFRPAYEALALLTIAFPGEGEVAEAVRAGARRYPFSAELRFGLSELALKQGDLTTAHAEATQAVGLAGTGDSRILRLARKQLAEIDARRGAASAAVTPFGGAVGGFNYKLQAPAGSTFESRLEEVRRLAAAGQLREARTAFELLSSDPVHRERFAELSPVRELLLELEAIAKAERLAADGDRAGAVAALRTLLTGPLSTVGRQRAEAALTRLEAR